MITQTQAPIPDLAAATDDVDRLATRSEPASAVPEPIKAATYTVAELATLLGVSDRHVNRLRSHKKIPGEIRIGRCVRFGRAIIDRWLSTTTIPTTR